VSEPVEERTSAREWIAYGAFATVAWLGRVLPTVTGRVLFRWAGSAAFLLLPRVRAVVEANQARVLGRPPHGPLVMAATRQAFRTYARYWFDAFDVVTWPDDLVRERFTFDGFERLQKPVADGTGVIAVLPHMGNWDAAGRAVAANGLPIVSVAEKLRPEGLFRLFLEHRRALGMEIFALDAGGVGRQLGRSLADAKVVALVADRDLSGRGVEVEMFGRVRRLPAGPALLSLQTGAPIVVADVYETRTGWRCVLHEPVDVPRTGDRRADVEAITREMAAGFERAISASPSDWHMFQPAWDGVTDPKE
jgi:lauroyl/myristoyl acyltransferase